MMNRCTIYKELSVIKLFIRDCLQGEVLKDVSERLYTGWGVSRKMWMSDHRQSNVLRNVGEELLLTRWGAEGCG
jgi:hypothetical protein